MATLNDAPVWRAPLVLSQVPDTGLHVSIEADEATRRALAETAGVRHLTRATASFDIAAQAGGSFHVIGRVRASIGQTCVVTLEPLDNEIDEPIEATFASAAHVQATDAARKRHGTDGDQEDDVPDPAEPIVNGQIDLGRLAQEYLMLGIDPYPRKEGAAFDVPETPPDPDDHPFAGLKALKDGS